MQAQSLFDEYKHLFGTYSVMSIMNIITVLNHIHQIAGLKRNELSDDDSIFSHPVLKYIDPKNVSTTLPEKRDLIEELLLEYLPFLKAMKDCYKEVKVEKDKRNNKYVKDKKQVFNYSDIYCIYWTLYNIFSTLINYRDKSCHYRFIPSKDQEEYSKRTEYDTVRIINKYYTYALRKIKEKYGYTTEQLSFIQKNRYTDDKKVNFNFFLSMQSSNNNLSHVGVAQLICLFLEKKDVDNFLENLPIYDNRYCLGTDEYMIIKRSLALHSIKLPKERLNSEKKDMAIAMDMLNELKRCPKELFNTLPFDKQERFRIISSDHKEVLLMRSTDRFVPLILQYIDCNKKFKDIRFHVNMGKLRYLFSPNKLCIDNQERVRVLEHLLNGYGRIDEVEYLRKAPNGTFGNTNIPIKGFGEIERDSADSNNYPYIVDTHTYYILNNNKVEFCFCKDGKKKNVFPTIEKEINGKWYVEKTAPHCRISFFEIPAMAFHMFLCGSEKTEKLIKDVYNNYISLFNALKNGALTKENYKDFNIPECDIPKKILDFLKGKAEGKSIDDYVKNILKKELKDTRKRIEQAPSEKDQMPSKRNKIGTKSYKRVLTGKLADFLAKDIVKFQPTLCAGDDYGIDRMTGMNYRIMQATIATYNDDDDFDTFYNVFKMAGLVDGDERKNHPFLKKVLLSKPQNTVAFNIKYLKEKEIYLRNIEKKNIIPPFVNRERNKWCERDCEYYRILGENLLDLPIELPRQMFYKDIRAQLEPLMPEIDFSQTNTTYLIAEYLKRVRGDDFQEFYSWERNYRYIDFLKCIRDDNGRICAQYTTTEERESLWEDSKNRTAEYKRSEEQKNEKKDKNFEDSLEERISSSHIKFQNTEKHIRRYKVQDALLFMIAEKQFGKYLDDIKAKNFKLKDIMPDTDKGILSEAMPIDFTFTKKNIKYNIHAKNLKFKEYGDLFILANDKRLESLWKILATDTVNKEEISEEFAKYDFCRPDITKLVLDFEKDVLEKYPEIIEEAEKDSKKFDFKFILDWLINKKKLNYGIRNKLLLIRNAFNHNSYPDKKYAEVRELPEIATNLKKTFDENARKYE